MSGDLVSIVVPTFNRAYCLPRALDSLVKQTYHNLEIIVVDDGSTDETPGLVGRRYGSDARVRYFRQPNGGVSAARNTGLAQARGRYVALLDSDDWWYPWKAELQVECLEAMPGLGMVWTDMEAVGPEGSLVCPRYLKKMYSAYSELPEDTQLFRSSRTVRDLWRNAPAQCSAATLQMGDIFSYMVIGNLVHTSTVMLTRERLEKVGGFREDLRPSGEDHDFHLRTCREGEVGFLDVASIRYQTGMADQLTRPEYASAVAENYLKTILPVIERDRARIALSEEKLNEVMASAFYWLGDARMNARLPGSREAFWRALKLRPNARTAALLALACAPVGTAPLLRKAYRNTRRAMAGHSPVCSGSNQ